VQGPMGVFSHDFLERGVSRGKVSVEILPDTTAYQSKKGGGPSAYSWNWGRGLKVVRKRKKGMFNLNEQAPRRGKGPLWLDRGLLGALKKGDGVYRHNALHYILSKGFESLRVQKERT